MMHDIAPRVVTVHSTAQDEYTETDWKAERLLRVFGTPLRCN